MICDNMKIKTILNKKAAYIDYIYVLLNNKNLLFDELVKPVDILTSINFTYNEDFKKIRTKYYNNFYKFIKYSKKKFESYWKLKYKKMTIEKQFIDNILFIYGEFICEEISTLTKVKWNMKNIEIILTLRIGGMNDKNKIILGVDNKIRGLYIETLIHELIHLNTHKTISKFKFSNESEEIATTLITNKIIELLNNKYELNIKKQSFSYNLIKHKEFEKIFSFNLYSINNSFIDLIRKIEKILKLDNNINSSDLAVRAAKPDYVID